MQDSKGSDSDGNEEQESRGVEGNHERSRHSDGSQPSEELSDGQEAQQDNHNRALMDASRESNEATNGHADVKEELNPNEVAVIERHIAEHYSGPVPAAKEMQRYAKIDSSFPNRMMTMAEKQQDANIRIAERLSKSEAFSVPVVAICAAVLPWGICALCIWQGYAIPAWISGGAGLLAASAQVIRSIKGQIHPDNEEESDSK